MNLLDMSFKRTSYIVEVNQSILFECALGIAVITYPKLHGSLDKPVEYWTTLRNRVSTELEVELQFCQEHNTWKMLLQLIHNRDYESIEEFVNAIRVMDEEPFNYISLPYLEDSQEYNRKLAAGGSNEAAKEMLLACQGHPFFPQMIHTVMELDYRLLQQHLMKLIELWYVEIVREEEDQLAAILRKDWSEKENWLRSKSSEEVVLRAAGVEYKPEPNVTKVLLIPHYIYRPWTIEATLPQTKIFYVPVSDTSVTEQNDPYQPPGRLVQIYKALGDEKRLRALKYICEQERSLKELTELLGIGKTTTYHHLTILRAAYLIRVKDGIYSWNVHALDHHEKELLQYLFTAKTSVESL